MHSIPSCIAFVLGLSLTGKILAQDSVLQVAVYENAPYAYRNDLGHWEGLSVELWESVMAEGEFECEYHPMTMNELLAKVSAQEVDVGIGAITITHEREQRVDFSHAVFRSGTGIAYRSQLRNRSLISILPQILIQIGLIAVGVAVLLAVSGWAVWLLERNRDDSSFAKDHRGFGTAFWWAAVTMTTVGYGDTTPRSTLGRAFAVVWMFSGILLVSMLTASITSILTLEGLHEENWETADLSELRVGAVRDSSGAEFLQRWNMAHTEFESLTEALAAAEKKQIDAVVNSIGTLQYLIHTEHADGQLKLAPNLLNESHISLALAPDSPHREVINRAVLKRLQSDGWETMLKRYLGNPVR